MSSKVKLMRLALRIPALQFSFSRFSLLRLSAIGFATLAILTNWCAADDWPQFLGENRNGVVQGSVKLKAAFPPQGPQVVWRVPGGVGMSGVAVADGKCLTIARRNGMQTLIALNRANGETVWQTSLAPMYENAMGDGARATPTVAGDRVFTFTGEGVLGAHNLADGSTFWTRNLLVELGGKPIDYGMSSSPLIVGDSVVGDLVVVQAGALQGAVVAVDAATGKVKWTAGNDTAGYSSPALLSIAGEKQIVAFTGGQCLGLDPRSGKSLWSYRFVTDYDCNTATPIEVDGRVFLSAGENHGSVMLQVSKQGDSYDVTPVWEAMGTGSSLRSEWQTPLHVHDYLFGFDNVGSAGPVTNLTCLDAQNGNVLWKKMRFGKSNGIFADGKLIISTMNGELVLVEASSSEFRELARAQLFGKTRQAPALADGFVLIRDDQEILCIDLRADATPTP